MRPNNKLLSFDRWEELGYKNLRDFIYRELEKWGDVIPSGGGDLEKYLHENPEYSNNVQMRLDETIAWKNRPRKKSQIVSNASE